VQYRVLSFVLWHLCRIQISEIDFQDSLKAVGLSEALQLQLLQQYVDNRIFIRSIQQELSMDLPHYADLEWRLDVKVTMLLGQPGFYASSIKITTFLEFLETWKRQGIWLRSVKSQEKTQSQRKVGEFV